MKEEKKVFILQNLDIYDIYRYYKDITNVGMLWNASTYLYLVIATIFLFIYFPWGKKTYKITKYIYIIRLKSLHTLNDERVLGFGTTNDND